MKQIRFGAFVFFVGIACFSFSSSVFAASPPTLFFSDLESGPKTGGENGNGAFVTLYGNNFGTSPTVTASATSSLAVNFTSLTTGVCTVTNTGTLTFIATGICTIAADQAGGVSYNAAAQIHQDFTVRYSTTPPGLFISGLSDGSVTTETTVNISGIVSDPNGIKSVTVNGTDVQVNRDGSFSFAVQLVGGANSIVVVVTSNAGISTTDTRNVTMDSTAPKLTITYPPDNAAVAKEITVTGSIQTLLSTGTSTSDFTAKAVAAGIDPTLLVTYSVNGSDSKSAIITGATYSFHVSLADGINTIKVFAANGVGQKVEAKRTVDCQQAFSLAIKDPAADIRLSLGSYILSGTVTENATPVVVTVTVDGQSFTPEVTNGVFQQQLSFSEDKTYTIRVAGVDQNDNSLTVQRNIIRTMSKTASGTAANFSIVDALLALQMTVGIIQSDRDKIIHLDVAPMINGVSLGDGKVDIEDVVVILRMAVGSL